MSANSIRSVDHVPDGVLVGLDQLRDRRDRLPPDEDGSIIARRNHTELVLPRRAIRCSFCPSCSVSRRTLTGDAIPAPAERLY